MVKIKNKVLFIPMLLLSLNTMAQNTLEVQVTEIKKVHGQIGLCIYNSEEAYMHSDEAVLCQWADVKDSRVPFKLESLPSGDYAIVIFQDLNGNKELDTNFMGIPKEPYGFSNNPSTRFGPPSFEGASFKVGSDTEIGIELK
ncbi:MAG: DUF2141 domain-containing protein [Cyclobacteriaceae bacterium]